MFWGPTNVTEKSVEQNMLQLMQTYKPRNILVFKCLAYTVLLSHYRSLASCNFNFYQTITYHAEGSRKRESRKIAEIKRPEIKPGDDDIWSSVEMLIPSLPPSHLQFCRIIDIEYEFKVRVREFGKLDQFHINL